MPVFATLRELEEIHAPKFLSLSIRDRNILRSPTIKAKRRDRIAEAIGWPIGDSQDSKLWQEVWQSGDFSVRLGKPGKEAAPDYAKPNPNDMLPAIFQDNKKINRNASFSDIFHELLLIYTDGDRVTLELLGCIFFRDAFLLDHQSIAEKKWRYFPPEDVLKAIEDRRGSIYGVPPEAFIQYVDALALNEDVKYLPRMEKKQNIGGRNTLLSCVHMIIALLGGYEKFLDFISPLIMRNVSPVSQKKAFETLNLLSE